MAVKYLRLFDPTQQFQLKGGQLNVAGRLYVHLESTDDLADLYDENGTQLTQPVILDNNGRAAGLFVDSSKIYWLDVQDQYGMSQFTIRKMTPCGGGGGANLGTIYELVSSDGSIAIDMTTEGNVTTYDLTRPDDSTELLEWIRCDGATKNSDTYTPIYTDGTMEIGTSGIKVYADRYYHVTAHVRASKSSVQPYYDKVDILFRLVDDNDVETNVIRQSVIVDSSVGLVQDFEVSTDVKVEEDAELILDILNTTVPGITWEVINLEAHRVFSGAPAIPGGVANKPWVDQNFQEKLTAGDNITIVNNVISATAAPQEQSDWTETDTTDVSYIKHKPSTKPVIAGENVTITEGTNSFIISANANSQVQADWSETDTEDPGYIQHKPDLSVYATDSELTSGLATKQDTISDLATIRSGASAGATAIQPSDLATVATTGDYNDLSNKPSIPSAQVNADWNSTSGVSEILNKPSLATVATSGAYSDLSGTPTLATVATSGSYADLSNKPNIPTVDQVYDGTSTNAQSGVAVASALSGKQDTISDLNTIRTGAGLGATAVQPSSLATVATTGAYSDLTGTPTINNVPAVTSSDDAKVLKASYTGGVGSYSWETETAGTVTDVTVDGSSVVSNGVAAITMPTVDQIYDSTSANAQSGVAMAGALSGKQDNMVVLNYGVSTWNDFITAYNKNAVVYCRYEVNSTQFRLAHLAFVNDSSDVTKKNAEFWFSRSIGTHTAAQQGDQIIVYKLQANGNVWTTATREIVLSAQAGDGITRTVTTAEGAGTIEWSVKPAANGGITVDANGVSVTNPIPSVTSSDDSKVLKATYSGGVGSYSWETESGGGSYTAGNGIAISNQNEISVNHDSTLSSSRTTTGNLGTYDRVSSYTIAYTLTAEEQAMLNGTSATPISSISISLASGNFTMDGYLSANEKLYLQISTDSSLSSANTARYYGSYVSYSTGDEETYNSAGTVTINMPVGNSTGWTSQSLTFGNKLYLSMCVASTSDTTSVVTDTSLLVPYVDAEYYNPAPTITYTSVSSKLSVNVPALTTAGITDIQQVNALPAQPVATVLYLIPET